jgi:hypothetical protein
MVTSADPLATVHCSRLPPSLGIVSAMGLALIVNFLTNRKVHAVDSRDPNEKMMAAAVA